MLKYDSFKPTIKYEITPCATKTIIKRFNFFCIIYKKKCQASQQEKKKAKHNKLSNGLNNNIRKKPIDLSIKNKQIASCSNLSFGTLLSLSGYIDTESTENFFLFLIWRMNTNFQEPNQKKYQKCFFIQDL